MASLVLYIRSFDRLNGVLSTADSPCSRPPSSPFFLLLDAAASIVVVADEQRPSDELTESVATLQRQMTEIHATLSNLDVTQQEQSPNRKLVDFSLTKRISRAENNLDKLRKWIR